MLQLRVGTRKVPVNSHLDASHLDHSTSPVRLNRCATCEARFFRRGATRCPQCRGDTLEQIDASGKGVLYSFVVMHLTMTRGNGSGDGVIAVVELEEGPRVMSRLAYSGPAADSLAVGSPVVVENAPSGASVPLQFRPV